MCCAFLVPAVLISQPTGDGSEVLRGTVTASCADVQVAQLVVQPTYIASLWVLQRSGVVEAVPPATVEARRPPAEAMAAPS